MNLKQVVVNGEKLNVGGSSTSPNPPESLPIDSVILWVGTLETIPTGWHLCDGTEGTFDLRGMFALGAGGTYNLGDSGGSEEVTLTVEQMPMHQHSISATTKSGTIPGAYLPIDGTSGPHYGSGVSVSSNGSSQSHPNMPPYKALYYIQKIA